MELRNLKRYFLTSKVLRKHNKTATFELTQKRLTILLLIYHMNHHQLKTTAATAHRKYQTLGHAANWMNFGTTLKELTAARLLEKIGSSYFVSIEGKLLLQKLETQLRKERLDR